MLAVLEYGCAARTDLGPRATLLPHLLRPVGSLELAGLFIIF